MVMNAIISKNGDSWSGIVLNQGKLYYTTYGMKSKEDIISHLKIIANAPIDVEERSHPIIDVINGIANGTNFAVPDIDFDFTGFTEKEVKVLKTLLEEVPAGKTISYGKLAEISGFPRAAQFVGNVMMSNRFGPIIPCHRVIKSDGKLGKFAGKSNNPQKKKLLDQEMKKKGIERYFKF
ncbi:MAG: MGMT family protein [Promethearchaeota archaeon]|nr:MAG: MGMT family protein [Candidatus Lokiarchaeota archaeon]